MKQFVFSISLLLFFIHSYAQEVKLRDDSLNVQFSENASTLTFEDLLYYDINGFQQYRPFGSLRLPMARSGNIGLPTHSYSLERQDWDINYLTGGYQNYLMDERSIRYYKMSRPFTQLKYTTGAEKEQLFNVFHSQNLGEGLNISFEYQRTVSEGFFIQQLVNHTQFNATYNLQSRNQRFLSKGYFIINDLEAQENGGVVLSEDNDDDSDVALLDINLNDAQNQIRTQELSFDNQYKFIQKDSTHTLLALSHKIKWNKAARNYKDDINDTLNFYENYFFDENQSADTTYAEILSNEIELNLFNESINLGYRNEQYHHFQNFLLDTNFQSDFVVAEINAALLGQEIRFFFEKGIAGFQKDELDLNATVQLKEWKGFKNSLTAAVSQKQPDYFLQQHRTNHFFYTNELETSKQSSISIQSEKKDWNLKVEVGIEDYSDYVYFDEKLNVIQHNDNISNLYLKLDKKFNFLRNFYLDNHIKYQQISDDGIIPLPELFSFHSFFYENDFAKSALKLQLGVDFYYSAEYNGFAYSPALSRFYLNNNINGLEGLNQVDLFLNIGINKSARLYVKMENILKDSFSEESYRIQDYPVPGRALKVGFSWRMIN